LYPCIWSKNNQRGKDAGIQKNAQNEKKLESESAFKKDIRSEKNE